MSGSIGGRLAAIGAVIVAAAALVLAAPTAAQAHVTVSASTAAPGAWTVLTFRAPTESDTASTVGLDIHLPTDTPFTSVRVEPVAGWSAQLVETELSTPVTDDDGNTITTAVTEIVWTATGTGLGPQEFGEFRVSVGPLPESGTLFFPTVQTYSDGTEVDWVQQAEDGSPEPDHPAPSVTVAADDTAETVDAAGSSSDDTASTSSASGLSLAFGIAGLVVALVAAGLGGAALARSRR